MGSKSSQICYSFRGRHVQIAALDAGSRPWRRLYEFGASGRPLNFTVGPHVNTDRPRRLRKLLPWFLTAGAVAVALAVWALSELSNCQYRETSPTYSPNGKFYTQTEFTLCRD